MGGTGVIDRFLAVFTQYIDSGFGLLGSEVAFIATTLIVIDVTLAALFWSWGADDDIIARLVKKTLFVGVFAYLIGNWNSLSRIVFESFAGLGLKASGTGMAEADFLRPGRIAQVGLDAGRPILDSISGLMGYVSFFENFIQITVLLFAWVMVLLAFFILAIQLFITLIEFKLTTLAGFVLIPFGLFGKTAFAAERVLGNVVSSGIKVLVLAVIVGIGSTLFAQFTAGFGGAQPSIDDAMAIVLAALALLGLGIFGPGIANGLVSGGPQLGAGAAVAHRPRRWRHCRGWRRSRGGRRGTHRWRRCRCRTRRCGARRWRDRRLSRGRRLRGCDLWHLQGRRGGHQSASACRREPQIELRSRRPGRDGRSGERRRGSCRRCVLRRIVGVRQPARLGEADEALPDHQPWRIRRHPRGQVR